MKILIPSLQTQTPQRVHFSSIFFISNPKTSSINATFLLSPSSPILPFYLSARALILFSSILLLSPIPPPIAKSAVPSPSLSPHLFLSTISIQPRALLLVAGRLSPPLGVRPHPDASRRPRGASRRAPAAGLRPSRRFLRRRRRRRSAGGSESA